MAKTIHMAGKINTEGEVSALCYVKPRPIDLAKASWTVRAEAVTCRKCRAVLETPAAMVRETN